MRCSLAELNALLRDRSADPQVTEFLIGSAPGSAAVPGGARWEAVADTVASASVFGFACVDDGWDEMRGLVAVGRGHAVRVQVRDDSVSVEQVRPDAPWPALVGCLPDVEPAHGCEVTVPTDVLSEALEAAGWQPDVERIALELRRRLVPSEDAQAVGELLHRADGVSARIEVALRGAGHLLVAPSAIDVQHCATGRVAIVPESPDDTFTLVTPASAYFLGRSLQKYVEDLWAATNERTQPFLAGAVKPPGM
ncbi:ESX secretion-associated protein EspG [Saccharopolyspora rosea]|uniref:ESX secretion-associated protein EspG n=1 Tax=Saccharopolyspora rosea TaxID=524884 RepID=A0ABW3G3H4_9PSEU|nr:ESX secretion-associated protein EspG [Saccharopolyspora rosea]